MNENLKTRREHLKVLPLQKRLQAMENIRKEAFPSFQEVLNRNENKDFTLAGSVTFSYTSQGHDYWWSIHTKYFQNGK